MKIEREEAILEAAIKAFRTKLVSDDLGCKERFNLVLADPRATQKEGGTTNQPHFEVCRKSQRFGH
jgi:hypothetical protein